MTNVINQKAIEAIAYLSIKWLNIEWLLKLTSDKLGLGLVEGREVQLNY
jgi:hypothetical protein